MFKLVLFIFVSITTLCSARKLDEENVLPDTINSYPFFATVHIYNNFACIGIILDRKYILTARVCIEGRSSNQMKVRVGSSNAYDGGSIHHVKKLIGGNLEEELIGLIELENSIDLEEGKTEVVEFFEFDKSVAVDMEATLVCLAPAESGQSRPLTTVQYKIVADSACNVEPIYRIPEKKVCAVSVELVGDKCPYGTLGAPILVNGLLVGVFPEVFHPPQERPEAYANALAYQGWIRESIGYEYVDH